MSKSVAQISVLTANRLGDGVVVFLDESGTWIEGITGAAVARSPEEVRALEAQGVRDAARNLVVEPYLIEVRDVAGGLTPVRTRERVRVVGPSILDDVPGYSPSPHRSSRWGEGRGEGQPDTANPEQGAAPHPSPLPASPQSGSLAPADSARASGERENQAEAA
jgi:uncharacterized protein DUF2849